MNTICIAKLNQALTTAPFQILDESVLHLTENGFADTELNDEHLDSKFYPIIFSKQNLNINGVAVEVVKKMEVAYFVCLNTITGEISGYVDEPFFHGLSEHTITFIGDNIAIKSEDGQILTMPTGLPNVFQFKDDAFDEEIGLRLPEPDIDEVSRLLEQLTTESKYADRIRNSLNLLV